MKAYVAASQYDLHRARWAMDELRLAGIDITHDWTQEVESNAGKTITDDECREAALNDYKGVVNCDVLLVLTPVRRDWGCAMWTELGIALDRHRRIVVVGPQRNRNIFGRVLCETYETDAEGVDAIVGMLNG